MKRNVDEAMRDIETSMKLLQTDYLDSFQIHCVDPAKDDIRSWGKPDGIYTLVRKLKEQKVFRFIGVTTHVGAAAMKETLEMYEFDTVLTTFNPTKERHDYELLVLPVVQKQNLGLVAMKIMGGATRYNMTSLEGFPAKLVGRRRQSVRRSVAALRPVAADSHGHQRRLQLRAAPAESGGLLQLQADGRPPTAGLAGRPARQRPVPGLQQAGLRVGLNQARPQGGARQGLQRSHRRWCSNGEAISSLLSRPRSANTSSRAGRLRHSACPSGSTASALLPARLRPAANTGAIKPSSRMPVPQQMPHLVHHRVSRSMPPVVRCPFVRCCRRPLITDRLTTDH